jgi:hypothetical protein
VSSKHENIDTADRAATSLLDARFYFRKSLYSILTGHMVEFLKRLPIIAVGNG